MDHSKCKVQFSKNGSIASTLTSLYSLERQVANQEEGSVANVSIENNWLEIHLGAKAVSNNELAISETSTGYSTGSLVGLSVQGLKRAFRCGPHKIVITPLTPSC